MGWYLQPPPNHPKGISLSDPDVFALDALGGVFNSFGGQLFDTLRSREGLAYSVSGGWDSPPDHPGLFLGGESGARAGGWVAALPAPYVHTPPVHHQH